MTRATHPSAPYPTTTQFARNAHARVMRTWSARGVGVYCMSILIVLRVFACVDQGQRISVISSSLCLRSCWGRIHDCTLVSSPKAVIHTAMHTVSGFDSHRATHKVRIQHANQEGYCWRPPHAILIASVVLQLRGGNLHHAAFRGCLEVSSRENGARKAV